MSCAFTSSSTSNCTHHSIYKQLFTINFPIVN